MLGFWLSIAQISSVSVSRKKTAKTLRRELDAAFGQFIRKRDTNSEGMGHCITCGAFTTLEAGHFIPRQHASLRWNPLNVFGQCSRCNRFLHGDQAEYYTVLVRRIGQDAVDELMRLKRTTKKHSIAELQELIAKFS